jgi:chromosome segregation ATPase
VGAQLRILREAKDDADNEIKDLQNKLNSTPWQTSFRFRQDEKATLENAYKALSSRVHNIQNEKADLQWRVREAEAQLRKSRDQKTIAESQNKALESRVRQVESDLRRARAEEANTLRKQSERRGREARRAAEHSGAESVALLFHKSFRRQARREMGEANRPALERFAEKSEMGTGAEKLGYGGWAWWGYSQVDVEYCVRRGGITARAWRSTMAFCSMRAC